MIPLVDYWLKANLFLVLFYACYALLLRRHTFLTLNRTYLMGSLAVAFVLPLIHVPGLYFPWPWEETNVPVYANAAVHTVSAVNLAVEVQAPLLPEWPVLALWAFGLVAAGLLGRTAWRTAALLRLIRQWPAQPMGDHTLVLPDNAQTPTFSFFRYLVLNPVDARTDAVQQHELVHIRQRHSLDILLLEVLHALCWLNPVFFGYRRAIRQVHEYLADRDATPQTADHRDAYARFLVSYAFHLPAEMLGHDSLAHSFGPNRPDSPTLKQRIQMLYQQNTRRHALWKYALVLPLATILLAMTSEPETGDESTSDTQGLVHVTGYIIDYSKRAIPGATIVARHSTRRIEADADGLFTIDVPANTVLDISSAGFQAAEIVVPAKKDYSVIYRLKSQAGGRTAVPVANAPESGAKPMFAGPVNGTGIVDKQPAFPGGMNAMTVYINKNLRYPARAKRANIQGKVLVDFLIGTDGAISQIQLIKGIQFGCDEEAIRLVNEMPTWTPGVRNGRPVAVRYKLQIDFNLSDKLSLNQKPGSDIRIGYSPMDSLVAPTATTFQMIRRADVTKLPVDKRKSASVDLNSKGTVVYILDGLEISKADMSKLNPASIQSMTILKNDAQPTFYKGKAVDGVIRITSKKVGQVGAWQKQGVKLSPSQMDVLVKNSPKIYYNGKTALIGSPAFTYVAKDSIRVHRGGSLTIYSPAKIPTRASSSLAPPLFLLDGEEMSQEAMDVIDPNTIQSVDVIRDASATAMYGEKGRNGVVRITTKKEVEVLKKKD